MNWLRTCRWLPAVHSDLGTSYEHCEHCEHRIVYRQSGEEPEASFAMDADYSLPVCSGADCSPYVAVSNCRREMNGVLRVLFLVGVVLAIGGTVSEAWAQAQTATAVVTFRTSLIEDSPVLTSVPENFGDQNIPYEIIFDPPLPVSTRIIHFLVGNAEIDTAVPGTDYNWIIAGNRNPDANDSRITLSPQRGAITSYRDQLRVEIIDDAMFEPDEFFTFSFVIPGYTVTPATLTITNNDVASSDVTLSALSVTLNGGEDLLLTQSDGTTTGFATTESTYTANAQIFVPTVTVVAVSDRFAGVQYAVGDDPASDAFTDNGVLPVDVGDNILTVRVTAEDISTSQDYTIMLTVPVPSSDATLSALSVTPAGGEDLTLTQLGTSTTGFATTKFTYTAAVSRFAPTVTVDAAATDSRASVLYAVGDDPASAVFTENNVLTVDVGNNTLIARVTAEDRSTSQDYTISLTVPVRSSDATLSALSVTPAGGEDLTLMPFFDADTLTYTADAPRFAPTVTVDAAATDSRASVLYVVQYGTSTISIPADDIPHIRAFAASGILTVFGGIFNTLTARVTAEDTTTIQHYTIVLFVPEPSNDATYSALSVTPDGGMALTLTPMGSSTTVFTTTALSPVATVTVDATATDSDASVQYAVGNLPGATFTGSGVLAVVGGNNILTVRITAEDLSTRQDYTIMLTVPLNTDATLSALSVTLNGGSDLTLTQSDGNTMDFDTDEFTYTANAPLGTTMVTVAATATDSSGARVQYAIGNPAGATFAASGDLTVAVGDHTLTARVTAEDDITTQDYTIRLTVPEPSNDATLSALSVTPAGGMALTLTQSDGKPGFDTDTLTYTATAPFGTSMITVAATATDSSGASVQYAIGNPAGATFAASGNLTVAVGDHTLTVRVTAEDDSTQDYTIRLTVPAVPSSDATLSALSVTPAGGSALTLIQSDGNTGFDATESTYTATAPFGTRMVTVDADATNDGADIQYAVGATSVTFDASGDLTVTDGDNVLTVRVTAEDGVTTQDYTITLTVTVSLLFKIKVFLEGAQ